jgi:hypothetical protein
VPVLCYFFTCIRLHTDSFPIQLCTQSMHTKKPICIVLGCSCSIKCLQVVTMLSESDTYSSVICVYSAEFTSRNVKRFYLFLTHTKCSNVLVIPSVEEYSEIVKTASHCHLMCGNHHATTQLKCLLCIWQMVHMRSRNRPSSKVCVTGDAVSDAMRKHLRGHWHLDGLWVSVIG